MKFLGKVRGDLIQFWVNSEKPLTTQGRGLLCFRTTACFLLPLTLANKYYQL